MYTLANWLMAHLAGVVTAWWLIAPNTTTINVVAGVTLVLTVLWMRFVWVRRARRLASEWEDLTPNLITHGPECRWDRRSRRHDEVYGAETRGGHP
jgi:hypothetical protein